MADESIERPVMERIEYMIAMLCAMFYASKKSANAKELTYADFMQTARAADDVEEQSAEEMRQTVERLNAAMGGSIR